MLEMSEEIKDSTIQQHFSKRWGSHR